MLMNEQPADWFADAARAFEVAVNAVTATDWDRPALGEWNVRDLVGHTARALITIEEYAGHEIPPNTPVVEGPVAYYEIAKQADPAQIAQRGRAAGASLGEDPASSIRDLTHRVLALVESTSPDAPMVSLAGVMTLRDYLPTRAFELTVHTHDLLVAMGAEPAAELNRATAHAVRLAAEMAIHFDMGASALSALTGRATLPTAFSVL